MTLRDSCAALSDSERTSRLNTRRTERTISLTERNVDISRLRIISAETSASVPVFNDNSNTMRETLRCASACLTGNHAIYGNLRGTMLTYANLFVPSKTKLCRPQLTVYCAHKCVRQISSVR